MHFRKIDYRYRGLCLFSSPLDCVDHCTWQAQAKAAENPDTMDTLEMEAKDTAGVVEVPDSLGNEHDGGDENVENDKDMEEDLQEKGEEEEQDDDEICEDYVEEIECELHAGLTAEIPSAQPDIPMTDLDSDDEGKPAGHDGKGTHKAGWATYQPVIYINT